MTGAHAPKIHVGTDLTDITGDCPITKLEPFEVVTFISNREVTKDPPLAVTITVAPGVTELPSLVIAVDGAIGDKYDLNIESTV